MRVEARHPDGKWLPLSPAAPLPAPQTHYQWRWTPLNIASADHPLTFNFSAGMLARRDELAQYGIIHDPHASSRLMIVEESEDTLALAEKVIAALTASAAGLIVVTAARGESRKMKRSLRPITRYGPCFASRPTNSRNG